MCGPAIHRRRSDRRRSRCCVAAVAANLGMLGYFKYYDFFASSSPNALCRRRRRLSSSPLLDVVAAGRHLVLHVPVDELRDRRLPRRHRADAHFLDVRASSSRSSRTWSPARSCAPTSSCRSSSEPRDPRQRRRRPRFCLIVWGLFKKVVIADNLADDIVDPVFGRAAAHSTASRCCSAIYAFAVQIYCDFSRLHRHRDRRSPLLPRLRASRRTSTARTSRDLAAGLLAPLAHHALALAARLPLHPARRQPRRRRCMTLPQPDAHDDPRRPLARRGLDVRALGRLPRRRAGRGHAARPGAGSTGIQPTEPIDRAAGRPCGSWRRSTSSASAG